MKKEDLELIAVMGPPEDSREPHVSDPNKFDRRKNRVIILHPTNFVPLFSGQGIRAGGPKHND